MRRRKDGTPVRVRKPGDLVNGFRLVRHVGMGHWLMVCAKCGGDERVDNPRQVEQKARCWTCRPAVIPRNHTSAQFHAYRSKPRGRVCRWCRRGDSATKFVKGSECGACQRTATRNGRESDGRPVARIARRVGALGKGVGA